ncbi:MAG: hypothetical protein A2138_17050 [Deltaproteobacteria bacterium RBG_16_71_12]|nr:MAG: hypothetical protein A2138_17050 [Deltaproteobacteria bacterium RBG_16_71_12]
MLVSALALALAAAPVDVLVVVPLCDGAKLACGNGALGDPRSLDGNLYWGARFGAERFLAGRAGVTVTERRAGTPPLLRELRLVRRAAKGEREVKATLLAFDGERIDDALAYFLDAVRLRRADLVVWAGHDRLMDVGAPEIERAGRPASVAVLACESERYFGPVLDAMGARAVALTRTFMAPEGYLLDALIESVAKNGPDERVLLRQALVAAYARWQRISRTSAATVFSRLE